MAPIFAVDDYNSGFKMGEGIDRNLTKMALYIDNANKKKKKFFFLMVDCEKAFDKVKRPLLFQMLMKRANERGIGEEHLIHRLQDLISETFLRVG
jgi:hypothetical protein